MNKYILLATKWLQNNKSVTHEELKQNVRVAVDIVVMLLVFILILITTVGGD